MHNFITAARHPVREEHIMLAYFEEIGDEVNTEQELVERVMAAEAVVRHRAPLYELG